MHAGLKIFWIVPIHSLEKGVHCRSTYFFGVWSHGPACCLNRLKYVGGVVGVSFRGSGNFLPPKMQLPIWSATDPIGSKSAEDPFRME